MTAIADLPDIRPSLLLDFANSGRVDPRIQCTRASAATCFGPDGKLRTVAANVPRIDYDPVTGKCLGLLAEEARTNLALHSGSIGVIPGAWSATRCTLSTVGNVISPVGTSAAKMVPDGTGSPYSTCLTASAGDGVSISGSIFVKSSGASKVQIDFIAVGGFSGIRCVLNFADGTIAAGSQGAAKVEKFADGWFRIHAYGASSNGTVNSFRITNPDATAGESNSFYFTGAQVELGAFPTSYIPTEGTAVTRAADIPTIPAHQLSAFGTLLGKYSKAGWKHTSVKPVGDIDLSKRIDTGAPVSDHIERVVLYPRQLTAAQITRLTA